MKGGDTRERQREPCVKIPYAEVIGDPIEHSRSPDIHRAWIKVAGIEGDYLATRVQPHELKDYLDKRRRDPAWRGCNVTAPLKERAFDLVDDLTDRARRLGAINLILSNGRHLIGDNSDLDGIAEAVPAELIAGKSAILIGAGGAARAALDHLIVCGAAQIQILARTPERALAMRNATSAHCQIAICSLDAPLCDNADILINASPMGMKGALMPPQLIDLLPALHPNGIVFDMVYEPLETALLAAARQMSLTTVDGLTMLIGQAATAFECFFGMALRHDPDGQLRRSSGATSMARNVSMEVYRTWHNVRCKFE